MPACPNCGSVYEGNFCPMGCDSPIYKQQCLERPSMDPVRLPPKTGIKRSLIVLIIVASILPVVLSIGNIAFNILYLSNHRESVSYSNRAENRYGIGRGKNTVYGMYEPGVYKNCDMTVTNVERSQGVSYDHPSAGMEYVIVTIRIRNISERESFNYSAENFQVKNASGELEARSYAYFRKDTALSVGYLNPGREVSGTVIFEQPVDSALTLCYFDHLNKDKLALQFKLQ